MSLNRLRLQLAILFIALFVGAWHTASLAAVNMSTTVRTAVASALITAAGAGVKMKWYNGTRPTGVSAVTGGNTLCATLTNATALGTATNGTVDVDEAGFTQSAGSHVTCTPTFLDITTSGDVVVYRIDVCGTAPCITFNGQITTGQNVTLTNIVITVGNQ